MENISLRPCPFCGSKDIRVKKQKLSSTLSSFVFIAKCWGCCAQAKSSLVEDRAKSLWNKRACL